MNISHTAPFVKQLVEPAFEFANHTESNSVPPYPVCEEKKCVDVATSDSSWLAPDCANLTSGDRWCKVMRAAGYTGGASPLACTFDVVNRSVSLVGIFFQTVQWPRVQWTLSKAV